MPYESFELVGTVTTLEQKKRQDGSLIPGFWTVKLNTAEGERTTSFNSVRRKVAKDPNSEMEPHPDFPVIQQAQATGETIRISGYLTVKGEKTFKNGTAAEIVSPDTVSTWREPPRVAPQVSSQPVITGAPASVSVSRPTGLSLEEERVWRALAIIVPTLEFEQPDPQEQVAWTRDKTTKLITLAKQIAASQGTDWGSPA